MRNEIPSSVRLYEDRVIKENAENTLKKKSPNIIRSVSVTYLILIPLDGARQL